MRHDCAKARCRCSFGEHMDAMYGAVLCLKCNYRGRRRRAQAEVLARIAANG